MVSLVVFAVGGLGALATLAAAERLRRSGAHAIHAGLQGQSLLNELSTLEASPCGELGPGTRFAEGGDTLRWTYLPVPGGAEILVVVSYAAVMTQRTDTMIGFRPCR